MAVQDIVQAFIRYVYNDMPVHMLYLPEQRIIGREELKELFWDDIESITEDEIENRDRSRQSKIDHLVWERVPYAMFSHRWLHRGEPTFQDMSGPERPQGLAGYSKLYKFCEKAQEYGCRLAWSDTCCIDKTSSAELEEAIRSMFRWYRNSRICIAYFAESQTLADFSHEVWFRRGWTLQELLAPRRMKFYGKEWIPFGACHNDKEDDEILKSLAKVTEIPRRELTFFLPGTRAIRDKMLWASMRETTRIEDAAYSLMGIFEITMSVAYGEGAWAFHRLMETIIQRCDGRYLPGRDPHPGTTKAYLVRHPVTALGIQNSLPS
ncbi:hypothetical protein BS17DRAFT_188259 [Gyrodon lividus]|nr:hypothetical protein BS17DRAFT_188259 [Gyrodon lividus]